jgi:hypothetical protein
LSARLLLRRFTISRAVNLLCVAGVAVALAGCGSGGGTTSAAEGSGATRSPANGGTGTGTHGNQFSSVSCSSSASSSSEVLTPGSGGEAGSCVFTFANGKQFRCPSSFGRVSHSLATLEHATACARLAPLVSSPAERALTARLRRARVCLLAHGLRVAARPVPGSENPNAPGAELIVGHGHEGAFVTFYENSALARASEPAIAGNARQLRGEAERRGSVIVLWLNTATRSLRPALQACGLT